MNKRVIKIKDLKPGMVAANEIICNNSVLIAEGVIITPNMINKLKEIYSLYDIEIYTTDKEVKNLIALEEATKTINTVSNEIESIFSTTSNIKISNTLEVNKYAKTLLDKLKINNSILKNIILNGSGEDCIYKHSVNVGVLSYLLGKWLGFEEKKLHSLVYASLLHDYGKTKINKNILDKPLPLSDEELSIIRKHPIEAYNDIKEIPFMAKSVLFAILMHHERCDGSGYPLGLKDEQIHEFAKIIAITDTFDALNSNRLYKKKKNPLESLKILKNESLNKFNYFFTTKFLEGMINFFVGQDAILNTGELCKIIKIDLNNIDFPLILCNNEFIDLSNNSNLYITELL